nr:MAG TPA: hypothetical protein [Caudoviricetes sp.]
MIADVMLVASVIAFAVVVKEIRSYFKEVGK